jgi:hypothetical protein
MTMEGPSREGGALSAHEKRRFQRFEVGMPVLVRQVVNEAGHVLAVKHDTKASQRMALCRDLSMTGLYFLSAQRYAEGDVVEIQITLGARTYKINGLVVRAIIQKLPGRETFGSGVQFVKSPSIEIVLPAIAAYLRHRFKSIGAPARPVSTKSAPSPTPADNAA